MLRGCYQEEPILSSSGCVTCLRSILNKLVHPTCPFFTMFQNLLPDGSDPSIRWFAGVKRLHRCQGCGGVAVPRPGILCLQDRRCHCPSGWRGRSSLHSGGLVLMHLVGVSCWLVLGVILEVGWGGMMVLVWWFGPAGPSWTVTWDLQIYIILSYIKMHQTQKSESLSSMELGFTKLHGRGRFSSYLTASGGKPSGRYPRTRSQCDGSRLGLCWRVGA